MGKGIMLQGTASNVGKSILAVGLCRIFQQDGHDVNPFKSQNMSLNSFITPSGHEIGRAQAMQAEACYKEPTYLMNPVLLKPNSDRKSQVIFKGKVHKTLDAVDYYAYKPVLKKEIKSVYDELASHSDIVVIEGAGSPAEINLNKDDFVNMGMAQMAKSPVLLIGDIDRGGVFASLAGTLLLMTEEEKKRVKGVIINKFRGSIELLESGLTMLEDIIKVPVLGVIPHFELDLEEEDSAIDFTKLHKKNGEIDIAIIRLPYMSNFTDFNCFKLYEDANIRFVGLHETLGNPDVVIIPGTKTTIHDMEALQSTGMDEQIKEYYRDGGHVFGICGGFQILGESIKDENHVETELDQVEGLGLLGIQTSYKEEKTTTQAKGKEDVYHTCVEGYEIHMGSTVYGEDTLPFMTIWDRNSREEEVKDGAIAERVMGTYLHGIFDNSAFTRAYLNTIREHKGLEPIEETPMDYGVYKDTQYNALADLMRQHLDMKRIYSILEEGIDG